MLFSLTKTSVSNGDALNSCCQLPAWSLIALYNYRVGDLREDSVCSVSVLTYVCLTYDYTKMDMRVFYFLCLGMLYIKQHLFRLCITVSCVCTSCELAPMEARRERPITVNSSYRQLWVLGPSLDPLQEPSVDLPLSHRCSPSNSLF